MTATADDITEKIFTLLSESTSKPAKLGGDAMVLDHPELPMDPSELPVVAVYLSEGESPAGEDGDLITMRTCEITVEVRAMVQHPVRGTRAFREWVLREVLVDQTLGGLVISTEYQGFKPYGGVLDKWLAGALLTFRVTYFWNPF